MISIQIADELADRVEAALDLSRLEQAAEQTLAYAAASGDLSLVLTGDEQIQALNRQFLDTDAPTDVLAFPAGEVDPDSGALYLGDVILSYPRLTAQAEAAGHSPLDEALLLVVHGVLHLLGHDHAEPEEKAAMWAAQAAVLQQIGCAAIPPPL